MGAAGKKMSRPSAVVAAVVRDTRVLGSVLVGAHATVAGFAQRSRETGPFGGARHDSRQILDPATFLKKKCPALHRWMLQLFRHEDNINTHVVVRNRTEPGGPLNLSISMWGVRNEYVLCVRAPSGKPVPKMVRRGKGHAHAPHKTKKTRDQGYMGLRSVRRAPYAGEQHRRGHDMCESTFSQEGWDAVLRDILLDCLAEIYPWARGAIIVRSKRGGKKKRARRR